LIPDFLMIAAIAQQRRSLRPRSFPEILQPFSGFAGSLNQPGGNATGVNFFQPS
jgi:hypothetical protein